MSVRVGARTWRRYDARDITTLPGVNVLVWIFGPNTLSPVVGFFDGAHWRTYLGTRTRVTAWHALKAPAIPMDISRSAR